MKLRYNSGFTLVELMVVMVILAIMASIMWSNFSNSIIKGKDSKRKQDLQSVVKSIEVYYNDMRMYPTPGQINWGQPLVNPSITGVVYMQKLPSEATASDNPYCYQSDDGGYYKIYAKLENTNDTGPGVLSIPVSCGGKSGYNYGISSPNTTP